MTGQFAFDPICRSIFFGLWKIRRYEEALQIRNDNHHVLNHTTNKNIELKMWSPATTIKNGLFREVVREA
jgi:hypothetical protein